MSINLKKGNIQRLNTTNIITGTLPLTVENSGSTVFISCFLPGENAIIDLPPVNDSLGCNYDFLIASFNSNNTVKINARDKAGDLEAKIYILGNHSVSPNNTVTITPDGSTLQRGDRLSIISNGSNWFLNHIDASNTTISLGSS